MDTKTKYSRKITYPKINIFSIQKNTIKKNTFKIFYFKHL